MFGMGQGLLYVSSTLTPGWVESYLQNQLMTSVDATKGPMGRVLKVLGNGDSIVRTRDVESVLSTVVVSLLNRCNGPFVKGRSGSSRGKI